MKRIISILCLLLPFLGFGQYNGPMINDSIIRNNKVLKCSEYNMEDSISFYEEFENGYYWIYNHKGLKVEENAYYDVGRYGYFADNMEFTVHYVYDNEGRNICWMWYDNSMPGKISRVHIEEYDTLGNNIGHRNFNVGAKYADAYKTWYHSKTDYYNTTEIVDSLVSKTKKEYFHFINENRKDTVEYRVEYYSNNQVDSLVTRFNKVSYPPSYIQRFSYDSSSNLKQYEVSYYDESEYLERNYRTLFSENGLPKEKWYEYFRPGNFQVTHTGFLYEYYDEINID